MIHIAFFTEAEPRSTRHDHEARDDGALLGADEGGQVVEMVALVSGDGVAVAVVGPGRNEEDLPAGTGIEHFSARFPYGREPVLNQLDEREAGGLDHVHDGLLAWADAGRDEHGTALCHHQEAGGCFFNFVVGHLARTFNRHLVWAVEQKPVAHDSHVLVTNRDVLLRSEEFRMIALGP